MTKIEGASRTSQGLESDAVKKEPENKHKIHDQILSEKITALREKTEADLDTNTQTTRAESTESTTKSLTPHLYGNTSWPNTNTNSGITLTQSAPSQAEYTNTAKSLYAPFAQKQEEPFRYIKPHFHNGLYTLDWFNATNGEKSFQVAKHENVTSEAKDPSRIKREAQLSQWFDVHVADRKLGIGYHTSERIASALKGQTALGPLAQDDVRLLAQKTASFWVNSSKKHHNSYRPVDLSIQHFTEKVKDNPSVRAALSEAYSQEVRKGLIGKPDIQNKVFERLAEQSLILDADRALPSFKGLEQNLAHRFQNSHANATDILNSLADAKYSAENDHLSAFMFANPSHTLKAQRPYQRALSEALAQSITQGGKTSPRSETANRLSRFLETRGGQDILLDQKVPLPHREWALGKILSDKSWTPENTSKGWESKSVSEAFIRDHNVVEAYARSPINNAQIKNKKALYDFVGSASHANANHSKDPQIQADIASGKRSTYEGVQEIEPAVNAIHQKGGDNAKVTAMPVIYSANGTGIAKFNVYKVEGQNGTSFVDHRGHSYKDFEHWRKGNDLPSGLMTYAKNMELSTGSQNIVTENTPNVSDSFLEHTRDIAGYGGMGLALLGTGAILAGSGGAGLLLLGGAGLLGTTSGGAELATMKNQGHSVSPFSSTRALGAWAEATTGPLAITGLGLASHAAKAKHLSAGTQSAKSFATAGATSLTASNYTDLVGMGNSAYQIYDKWDEMAPSQRAQAIGQLTFFGALGIGVTKATGGRIFDGYSLPKTRDQILQNPDSPIAKNDFLGRQYEYTSTRDQKFESSFAPARREYDYNIHKKTFLGETEITVKSSPDDNHGSQLTGIYKNGNLHISSYSTKARGKNVGRELLSTAIEHIGPEKVKTVTAKLGNDNLRAYMRRSLRGANPTSAVWQTPLGKAMQQLGAQTLDIHRGHSITAKFGFEKQNFTPRNQSHSDRMTELNSTQSLEPSFTRQETKADQDDTLPIIKIASAASQSTIADQGAPIIDNNLKENSQEISAQTISQIIEPSQKTDRPLSNQFIPAQKKYNYSVNKNDLDETGQTFIRISNVESDSHKALLTGNFKNGNLEISMYETDLTGQHIGKELISTAIEAIGPEKVKTVSGLLAYTNEKVLEKLHNQKGLKLDKKSLKDSELIWQTPLGKAMRDLGFTSLHPTEGIYPEVKFGFEKLPSADSNLSENPMASPHETHQQKNNIENTKNDSKEILKAPETSGQKETSDQFDSFKPYEKIYPYDFSQRPSVQGNKHYIIVQGEYYNGENNILKAEYEGHNLHVVRIDKADNSAKDLLEKQINQIFNIDPNKNLEKDLLSTAIENLGPEKINTVSTYFRDQNFQDYQSALANGQNESDAAWQTPFGKMMRELGFTAVSVDERFIDELSDSDLQVTFGFLKADPKLRDPKLPVFYSERSQFDEFKPAEKKYSYDINTKTLETDDAVIIDVKGLQSENKNAKLSGVYKDNNLYISQYESDLPSHINFMSLQLSDTTYIMSKNFQKELISTTIESVGAEKVEAVVIPLGPNNISFYNQYVQRGFPPVQAAWKTPLGKTMKDLGFTYVTVQDEQGEGKVLIFGFEKPRSSFFP